MVWIRMSYGVSRASKFFFNCAQVEPTRLESKALNRYFKYFYLKQRDWNNENWC